MADLARIFTVDLTDPGTWLRPWPPIRSLILSTAEEGLLKLGESRAKNTLLSTQQVFDGEEGGVNAFLDPARRVQGTGTGFLKFDEMTGGMRPGELIILAARPAMARL